ncbi:hypothetical protein CRG98_034180, partial [Punica granatum]
MAGVLWALLSVDRVGPTGACLRMWEEEESFIDPTIYSDSDSKKAIASHEPSPFTSPLSAPNKGNEGKSPPTHSLITFFPAPLAPSAAGGTEAHARSPSPSAHPMALSQFQLQLPPSPSASPFDDIIHPSILPSFLSPPLLSLPPPSQHLISSHFPLSTIMWSSSNFSSSPLHALLASSATSRSLARVSFHPSSLNLSSRLSSLASSAPPSSWISSARLAAGARRSACPCVLYSFRIKGMAELVQDKDATVTASGSGDDPEKSNEEVKHSRTFIEARSEEELLSGIRKEAKVGTLSPNMAAAMEELFHNYKNAVLQSGIPNVDEVVLSNMSVCLDRVLLDVEEPFVFSPYHKALRKPFDYYMFGQNYIRPLIDF